MQKRKISIGFVFLFMAFFLNPCAFAQSTQIFPPNDSVRNIMLTQGDFPQGFSLHVKEHYFQSSLGDGWEKIDGGFSSNDVVPGISHSWRKDDFIVTIRYGLFATFEAADFSAKSTIFQNNEALSKTHYKAGSFSGVFVGDSAFRWEWKFEEAPGVEFQVEDNGILSFSKGRYAAMLDGVWADSKYGTKDKTILDTLALKIGNKIDVATALDNINSISPLLHSLQVKLDAFTKNYQKGQYRPALNEMDAFQNELDAQRGKKISENDYQQLKNYANAIITVLNSLI